MDSKCYVTVVMKEHLPRSQDHVQQVEEDGKTISSFRESILHTSLWTIMLVAGTVIYGSYSVLVHLCEVNGKIPFSSSSVVLMIEVFKLLFCLMFYLPEALRDGFHMPTLSFSLPFAIPAVLYCINNNLALHMQLHMDPTTYQVLGNMKTATTAILYRLIIKRQLSGTEWISVFLLTVAGVFDSYGGFKSKGTMSASIIHVTFTGIVFMSTYCTISGMSGVYTEYILKRHYKTSLFLQNILLYMFGIIINGGLWIIQEFKSSKSGIYNGFFRGFTVYTWIIVITQVGNGLIMSAVMKHANNITRLFIVSSSMIVTTVLSVLVFNTQLNFYFFLSLSIVIIALFLYHNK